MSDTNPGNSPAVPRRPSRRALILLVIVLLALAAFNYTLWLRFSRGEQDLSAEIAAQTQTITALQAQVQHDVERLDRELADLQARSGAAAQWALAEAEYLLRIANYRLQLEADTTTALQALRSADEVLRQLDEPALQRVREQLAGEIEALRAVEPVDVPGAAARLSGVAARVAELPLPHPGEAPADAGAATEKAGADQQATARTVWRAFRELVVIRRTNEAAVPLLSPEQRMYLRQNLGLKLDTARLALLRRDQALWRASLDEAVAWLGRYFDTQAPATKAAAQSLRELARLQVQPALPDISGSLRGLRELRRQGRVGAVATRKGGAS